MNNFLKRTIFGSIYVALVVCSLLFAKPYFFQLVFITFAAFATREFYLINHSSSATTIAGTILAWLLFAAISTLLLTAYYKAAVILLTLYAFCLIATIVAELFLKHNNPIREWGLLLAGQIMIALPFALMNTIFAHSNILLLSLFIIIWLNDTGAYCIGSLLGKHKLFPRVSPGKTWEGTIGGAIFAIAAAYVLLTNTWQLTNLTFSNFQALLLGTAIVIAATLGDLTESLLKRQLGIKDSGNVLPGHGGFLDRFDSIILATPILTILLTLIQTL